MKTFLTSIYAPILLFVLAFCLNLYTGNVLIPLLAPDRYPMVDISFRYIPYWRDAYIINDLFLLLQLFVFIYLLIKNRFRDIKRYLWILAAFYTLRGIIILFNPVVQPYLDYAIRYDGADKVLALDMNGSFFSGHTGTTVLLTVFIAHMKREWVWYSILASIVIISMIMLARSHYLIDVYGAIVTAILLCYIGGVIGKR